MKLPPKLWILLAPILLLLALAVGVQTFFHGAGRGGAGKLPEDLLPSSFAGWKVENLSYADSPTTAASIEEHIGYDDYVYRRFSRGDIEIVVDLTHWGPRRRHFLDVSTHAPDNCWITAGLRLVKKNPPLVLRLADGRELKPAESRVFTNIGRNFYVVYWHLLGNERIDYTRYGTGKTLGFIWDNVRFYWRGSGGQFFLNINSNVPLERIENEPLMREILLRLANFLPLAQ